MSRKKLVLLDGSSIIYRAFFALPPLTTADGTPTNAVYGFTSMLLKLLEDERPDVILIAFEGGRTFRHTEFREYKSHRPRTPDDLAVQGPLARALAAAMQVPTVQHTGFEADDVLGTLSVRGEADGYEVVIVTGDLDALQLITPHVKVIINRRGTTDTQLYDEVAVQERFGLPPTLLPDFKALKGDTSDNIPGIAGIGDKTATSLLVQYGNLEGLLEHAEEVKAAKVRTNLIEGREAAPLYKRLATIVCDLPLETPWEEWAYTGPDLPKALELFDRLEFRTLGNRLREHTAGLRGGAAPEAAAEVELGDDTPWRRIETDAEVAQFVEAARAAGRLAVRSLVNGNDARTGALWGLALATEGETVVLSAEEAPGEGLLAGAAEPWSVPEPICELLADEKIALAAHDLKREWHALLAAGVTPANPGFDSLLAAYVLNPGRSNYRLEDLAREHLRRDIAASGEPVTVAAREAAAVRDLWEPLRALLEREELAHVYDDLELPLAPLLARMEALGVGVDKGRLDGLSERLNREVRRLEGEAHAIVGHPFNIGSPKQLQEILFTELGLPAGKKTKTGYSTDSDVLQDLAVTHPLPALILEWREVSKLKSTYTDALRTLIDPRDGRVHTRLNQAVAATGRLSSSDPNLQNIPVRTEVGREIRSAFIPAPGMRLLSADYSQIELRLMAHVTHDPEMVRAFREGLDIHTATAAQVFSVPVNEVTSDQRRAAKTVNFAVMYGQREFGLSRQLRIGLGDAKALIEAYFQRFPGVSGYVEDTLKQARRQGFVATLPPYARRRYVPGIHAGNRNERLAAEREAVNAPLQGTAADIIKRAMLNVEAAIRREGLRSRMILQVHDELVFEIVPEEQAAMVALARREMESAAELDVPLVVEAKVGDNWRDSAPVAREELVGVG